MFCACGFFFVCLLVFNLPYSSCAVQRGGGGATPEKSQK